MNFHKEPYKSVVLSASGTSLSSNYIIKIPEKDAVMAHGEGFPLFYSTQSKAVTPRMYLKSRDLVQLHASVYFCRLFRAHNNSFRLGVGKACII